MKKIAVNTMKTFLKENKPDGTFTERFEVEDSSFEVVFRTSLSIVEKSTFINRVLSGCFDSAGNFRPEYVTPVLRATVLQMCTNVPAMTVKNETAGDGVPALDLDAMDRLYTAMDLDHIDNSGYQKMLSEMTGLCSQAVEWRKSHTLSNHNTDSALKNLLDALTAKIESIDMEPLARYAGVFFDGESESVKDDIAKKLIDLSDYRDKIDI